MNNNVKKTAFTGVLSAMIFVLTYFVKIPIASGYVHLGDAVVYLSACLLGCPWALLAGAIGEGLADLLGGYAVYAPVTIIVKVLLALLFALIGGENEKIFSIKTALLTIPAGLVTVGGYLLYDLLVSRAYALVNIPANAVQAIVSAVAFMIMAVAFDKTNLRNKIKM